MEEVVKFTVTVLECVVEELLYAGPGLVETEMIDTIEWSHSFTAFSHHCPSDSPLTHTLLTYDSSGQVVSLPPALNWDEATLTLTNSGDGIIKKTMSYTFKLEPNIVPSASFPEQILKLTMQPCLFDQKQNPKTEKYVLFMERSELVIEVGEFD